MTSYERVLATINHERPDRTPCNLLAIDKVVESLVQHLGKSNPEEAFVDLGIDFREFKLDIEKKQPLPDQISERYGQSGTLSVSPYGVVLLENPNFPQAHRVHGPFYDSKNLDQFDWPKTEDIVLSDRIKRDINQLNEAGICTGVRYDNPFKIAYFMRRFDDFMADCLLDPDYIIELMRRIADVEVKRAEIAIEAGVRSATISGDFADQRSLMVSPAVFRRVLKPILSDMAARLKKIRSDVLLFLHSDGNLFDVLPDLIDCGFDAVHPIQLECMDMLEVKRTYGDRLTLFGGMSVQSELPFLGPNDIRALVRKRINQLGADGGFMLAPTNTILPDVPPENTVAMFREATGIGDRHS